MFDGIIRQEVEHRSFSDLSRTQNRRKSPTSSWYLWKFRGL